MLALAALAAWKKRTVATWSLLAAALVTAVFSFGKYLPLVNRPMFDYFPLFDAFRAPEIWLIIVEFSLATLAGIGLATLLKRGAGGVEKGALIVFGAMLALAALAVTAGPSILSFEKEGEVEVQAQSAVQRGLVADMNQAEAAVRQAMVSVRNDRRAEFSSAAMKTALFLLVGLGLVWAWSRSKVPGWVVGMGLAALVTVDLWSYGRQYVTGDRLDRRDAEASITKHGYDDYPPGPCLRGRRSRPFPCAQPGGSASVPVGASGLLL